MTPLQRQRSSEPMTSLIEMTERARDFQRRAVRAEAEAERLRVALHAIAFEAQACQDVNEPVGLGWLITTCEEAMQGV